MPKLMRAGKSALQLSTKKGLHQAQLVKSKKMTPRKHFGHKTITIEKDPMGTKIEVNRRHVGLGAAAGGAYVARGGRSKNKHPNGGSNYG